MKGSKILDRSRRYLIKQYGKLEQEAIELLYWHSYRLSLDECPCARVSKSQYCQFIPPQPKLVQDTGWRSDGVLV